MKAENTTGAIRGVIRGTVRATMGAALLATASAACALGLGSGPSALLLGEFLDYRFPVRLEPGEELAESCVSADVYFGDNKLPASLVHARIESRSDTLKTVRVLTDRRIDEPVVMIYVVAGCKEAHVSRKFVAFADPPGMSLPTLAQAPAAPAASASVAPAARGAAATPAPSPAPARLASDEPAASLPASPARPASPGDAAQPAGPSDAAGKAPLKAAAKAPRSPGADKAGLRATGRAASRAAEQAGLGADVARPRTMAPPLAAGLDAGLGARPDARQSARRPGPEDQRGARLQLDPVEGQLAEQMPLRLADGLASVPADGEAATAELRQRRAAAAAMWLAMNASPEERARDRQRLEELEARFTKLQAEAASAQQTVAALKAQVRQAERGRPANGLVLGLAALAAMLAGALAWTLWRQRQTQGDPQWWASSHADDDSRAELAAPSAEHLAGGSTDRSADRLTEPSADRSSGQSSKPSADMGSAAGPSTVQPASAVVSPALASSAVGRAASGPAPAPELELPPLPSIAAAAAAAPAPARKRTEPARAVSVEELIDLEQQAEFFLVLGQDQAAIDLLESHIASAGTSPLPYLKLLELFQRRGDRADYERMRDTFNAQFNAYAPDWDADLQQGHTLGDYPGVVERLQSLWPHPDRAMDVLQASLLRRTPDEETFDLPAYRELLFLYSVARDLAEHEDSAVPVDLLLPIDAAAVEEPVVPLTATRPVKTFAAPVRPLAVDVALPDDAPAAAGTDRPA